MLIAKRLTGSQLLATIAGFLLAIEGNAIVMSRVSLLDGILALFALLGFGAVLLDREWSSVRLAAWIGRRKQAGSDVHWGPALWNRPWLIAAGVAFGLASAVKWSGLYFLAGFAVYTLVSDALARRRAGLLFWGTGTLVEAGPGHLRADGPDRARHLPGHLDRLVPERRRLRPPLDRRRRRPPAPGRARCRGCHMPSRTSGTSRARCTRTTSARTGRTGTRRTRSPGCS